MPHTKPLLTPSWGTAQVTDLSGVAMSIREELPRVLAIDGMEAAWDGILNTPIEDGAHLPVETAGRLREWIRGIRADLLRVVDDVEDDIEMVHLTAIRYIELKSHWMTLNTQINYRLVKSGIFDPELSMRASLTSGLLMLLERFVDTRDVDRITTFLAQPLVTAG